MLAKAIEIPQQFEMSPKQMKIVRKEDSQVAAVSVKPKYTASSSRDMLIMGQREKNP